MLQYLLPTLCLLFLYKLTRHLLAFRSHIHAAQKSGLHYEIVPLYFLNRFWLITHPFWCHVVLRHLPRTWTKWVDLCLPEFSFSYRYDIFRRVGHDTFLTASPGGCYLWTCDPAVITQMTTRRNDFPKPTRIYESVNIYGKNVVSSEGAEWRYHRKATSPPFTEKNNHIVWGESIAQAQAMLGSWVGRDGRGDRTVSRVMDDTMRLSLHVISRAGFGRHLEWPSEEGLVQEDEGYRDPSKIKNQSEEIVEGHTMSYTYAIHCLLDNILFQFLVPRWVLRKSPFKMLRKADEAFQEWGKYMQEMVATKKRQIATGEGKTDQMDILGQLVKGQVAAKDGGAASKGSAPALTDEEILGNSFVLILAGHETAANSIHFAILYLALYPPSQRRLQKDLDQIFNGKPPSEWDYDRDLPALFGGMAGAVLNEELRLVPPVPNIPKSTIGEHDQPLTVEGKKCVIPKNTLASLCAAVVQRNPKYWPSRPPVNPGGKPAHPVSNVDNDLEEFRPERWLVEDKGTQNATAAANGTTYMPSEKLDSEGIGVNESSDTSEKLFAPTKGAYIPFSDGYRACLGRRFAQVEVLVTLAVLFQNYSVELAVDKYASDVEVEAMDKTQRAEVWQKAAEDARDLMLNGLGMIITMQMRKGNVSVRFVPRGKERFEDNVDVAGRKGRLRPGEIGKKDEGWRCWY